MENTFGVPIIPENEAERVARLIELQILDTLPEKSFDNVAAIAAQMLKVPIALVSFVDSERVWFKANVGMENTSETSRGISLCSLVIVNEDFTVFKNAPTEPCLLANPLVAGEFGLRFYAGAPIKTADGFTIGSVCVVDKEPRDFSEEDQRVLEHLAAIVMDELEQRN
jgi:GAF domain-containing protein